MVKIFIPVLRALLVTAFLSSLPMPCHCATSNDYQQWVGEYQYKSSFDDGIQPVITDIDLSIDSDGACLVSWTGFQKDEHIVCKLNKKNKNEIDVSFLNFIDGSIANAYGVVIYQQGERLFYLKHDGKDVITVWGLRYRPPNTEPSGTYFLKTPKARL